MIGVGLRGLGRGYSSANRSSAPAHSDPLGYSGISPTAGQVLQKIIICTPTRRGPTFVRTKVGKIRLGLCPKTPVAGCAGYGLNFGGSRNSIRTAHRYAPKVATAHLPLPPCGARKNLRTIRLLDFFDRYGFSASLHPPPAALGSESPHPLSRCGKGARMGGQVGTESDALGVLGLAKTVSRKPMVMVSGAIGLHGIGGRSPPPKRGRLGGGRCACNTL